MLYSFTELIPTCFLPSISFIVYLHFFYHAAPLCLPGLSIIPCHPKIKLWIQSLIRNTKVLSRLIVSRSAAFSSSVSSPHSVKICQPVASWDFTVRGLCLHAVAVKVALSFYIWRIFLNSPLSVLEHDWFLFCFFMPQKCPFSIQQFYVLKESTLGASAQYLFEGLSKVFVKDGVYDWVEWGVAVTNPEEKCKEWTWDGASLWAHCLERVGEEEGEPAHHKDTNDHCQDKGETFLSVDHGFTPRCSRVVICFWLSPWHQTSPLWSGNHVAVALDWGWGVDPPSSRRPWHAGAAASPSMAVLHIALCAWTVSIVIVSLFLLQTLALLPLRFSLGGRLRHSGGGWGDLWRGINLCGRGHGWRRGWRLQEIIGCGIWGGLRLCWSWRRCDSEGGGSGIWGFVGWRRCAFFFILPIGLYMPRRLTWCCTANPIFPGLSWWAACSLLGYLVNSYVDQDHDETWSEEGANGGVKDVPALIIQLALRSSLTPLVATLTLVQREQGREGDNGRDEPHHHNSGFDAFGCPLTSVSDPGDWQVAVQRDGTQVHDGGGAEQHVQRQVDLTPQRLEVPVAKQFVG